MLCTWMLQGMHMREDINFHVIYILIMSSSIDIIRCKPRLASLANKSKVLRAKHAALEINCRRQYLLLLSVLIATDASPPITAIFALMRNSAPSYADAIDIVNRPWKYRYIPVSHLRHISTILTGWRTRQRTRTGLSIWKDLTR